MSLNENRNPDQTAKDAVAASDGSADSENGVEPWPLATDASLRVLAWPKYNDMESLKRILMVAEPLFNNRDACLILRHDPKEDIPYEEAAVQLQEAFEAMGLTGDLRVLFVDDEMAPEDWSRLAMSVTCVLHLDTGVDDTRKAFISAMEAVEIIAAPEAN